MRGRGRGRARARGADGRLRRDRAPSGSSCRRPTTRSSPRSCVETTYHVLWELVHVFFEHRGLLGGPRRAARRTTPAPSSFLYPFLAEAEDDLDAVLADVRDSARRQGRRGRPTCAPRRSCAAAPRDRRRGRRAARACSTPAARCWRSATAARRPTRWTLVADLRDAAAPRRACARAPRLDLTEDPAILTAIANDVGHEAVFARQIIAYGGAGDVARSRCRRAAARRNVIAALERGARATGWRRSRSSATTAAGSPPRGWPTTSSSRARSTSRASRRRRRPCCTRCGGWSRSRR